MISNESGCKASSCCHWNTWESGAASFDGQGRCWSSIGTNMCDDTSGEGTNIEVDGVICPGQPAENFCDGDGDCVDHSDWCSCAEAQALCSPGVNGEEYCESDVMISNESGCKASSCCHWNTWES